MRSEQEMMNLIMNTAEDDDRIRAVYLSGSRVDPNGTYDDIWVKLFEMIIVSVALQ